MTEIVNGVLQYNELTQNANGGTELMARRMVRDIPQDLLKGVQIIHSRVRELQPDMKRILVCHDLAQDPEVAQLADPEYRKQFDKIVFVSNWQQHMYNLISGVPFNESYVIPNGIEIPKSLKPKRVDGPLRLIYHTTPHRGLNLLIPAFIEASKHFEIHLDVFSSFDAYGWGDRDKEYEKVFELIDETPNITNHGFQPNDVVREYLEESHLFAYPNIWAETSCLSLIEAMCFGNFSIHSNLGALPETSGGLTDCYMYNENIHKHFNDFYVKLYKCLDWMTKNREELLQNMHAISIMASNRYNWYNTIQPRWCELLYKISK